MSDEKKMENPYHALGEAFVSSVMAGNRGKIEGKQIGLHDRLREYSYYITENMLGAGDAMLANDLLDAARRLDPDRPSASSAALQKAIGHIEHMAAWISAQNAGYSFESLGEDMPGIRIALSSVPADERGEPTRPANCATADAVCHFPSCVCVDVKGNIIDPIPTQPDERGEGK